MLQAPASYPSARRCDQTDVLHGETVIDPYRYLEDPDSVETKDFVDSQNDCYSKATGSVSAVALKATPCVMILSIQHVHV